MPLYFNPQFSELTKNSAVCVIFQACVRFPLPVAEHARGADPVVTHLHVHTSVGHDLVD